MYPNSFSKKNSLYVRFVIAILLNTSLAVTQVLYATQAHSVSLLSDALHNLGDVVGLLIAWGAQIFATYEVIDTRYTYGYKKLTILGAFMNALLLMSSVGIIVYEAIEKIRHPHPMDEKAVLLIASLGILINAGTALLFIKDKDNDINIRGAFLHLVLDAVTSLGVVAGALFVYYTHYQIADTLIACIIAIVIFLGSWKLLSHALALLLCAVPSHIDRASVEQYLRNIQNIHTVERVHIWSISTKETILTAHLITAKPLKTPINLRIIEQDLLNKFDIQDVTLQIS